jgi:hypothetical protein
VLTSAITVSGANVTAISAGDGVSIDLNGFEIRGTTSCTGAPATCSAAGTGNGISAGKRAVIRNGTVRKMGQDGIDAGTGSTIENVTVAENARHGITSTNAGIALLITHVRALQNGHTGVHMYNSVNAVYNDGTLIQSSTLYGNTRYGVEGLGVSVLDCNVSFNGDEGLYLVNSSSYGGNRVNDNNGGDANDQVFGGTQIGINQCGSGTGGC